MEIRETDNLVRRLYGLLESLGATIDSPARSFPEPQPFEAGADVWVQDGTIRIGTHGDAREFALDTDEKELEAYILANYENEIIF